MDNKEAVKRLLLLLGRYKKTIVVIVGCLLVSTGLNLCVPLISRRIMDDGFIGGNKKLLIELVLVSMVIYTINSLIDIVKEKKRVDISAKIQYFLSEQSFSHLMKLRVNYFNNTNYAETLNNINTDINQMTSIADSSVFFVITQAFSMTGGIIGLFIIDFRMTVLVLLFIPIKCVVMKYFAKKQKQIMDEFIKRNQEYAKWFGDTRMYEPTSGEILLGAENISELPLPEYRNMVSVVSQQIYLFNDTIRNNICLYKQIDDTVIEAACKDSGLEDFIKEVSLDHVVGQNGAMLSGGQKQKIALARALVHDKPIIIFDEATSNTDAYSEQQINGLLDTRLKDKTVIVITHKKEILSKVDQIVVLKEGVVADLGRYDDLIGKSDELNVMLEKAE